MKHLLLALWASALSLPVCAQDPFAPPKSLDARLKVELVAEQPEITTPTGIDVDEAGRVFVIENNTHFRPADYPRHPSDRVLIMTDTMGDARADKIVEFADGFTFAMSVAVKPTWVRLIEERTAKQPVSTSKPPVEVFVATRSEIVLCRDLDHDGKCDEKKPIIRLETKGNYPHNGIAGFAFEASGFMYFGFGENLGETYKIIGSDGVTLSSSEAGNMYRCWPDGSKLELWARGFWNPHASCIDARGQLFTVDNDPDSLPPCRLLHVVQGGDYGYRFHNGRKGQHPFTSWNGEVPNTLPMAAGTGEAPSGILAYEADGLPAEYVGNLLGTSWGDHRIDRFRLKYKQGYGTYESVLEPLIVGGENFRPVGIATAPDGSLFVSDWVLRDYKLHGKGRVWKISSTAPRQSVAQHVTEIPAPDSAAELLAHLQSPRRDVRRMAVQRVLRNGHRDWVDECLHKLQTHPVKLSSDQERALLELAGSISGESDPSLYSSLEVGWKVATSIDGLERPFQVAGEARRFARVDVPVEFLLKQFSNNGAASNGAKSPKGAKLLAASLARTRYPRSEALAAALLKDDLSDVRQIGVIWASEERMDSLRPAVEALLKDQLLTPALFGTILAGLEMLDGKNPAEFDKTGAARYALPLLADATRPFNVRLMALRAVPTTDAGLKPELLKKLIDDTKNPLPLRGEALLSLQLVPGDASPYFRAIAANENEDITLRSAALAALASSASKDDLNGPSRALVIRLLGSKHTELRTEALRAVRLLKPSPELDAALALVSRAVQADRQRTAGEQLAFLVRTAKHALAPELVAFAKSVEDGSWKPDLKQSDVTSSTGPQNDLSWRVTFFHTQGAGCFKCHTLDGRGGKIGPDLSNIGASRTREQLREAILKPSQEVAPQFTTWTIETRAGQLVTGMIVHENEGKTILGTAEGNTIELKTIDIAERTPQMVSVMPEKLHEQLTPSELEELLSLLNRPR